MKNLLLFLLLMIFTNSVICQTPSYMPSRGLLAWYPFTNNANDSSGYGHNGILYGDATYGTDRFGSANSCFKADGLSAIDFPVNNFPGGNSARTVSAFFKLSSPIANGTRELFAWGNNSAGGDRFGLEFENDTSIGVEFAGPHVKSHFNADTFWHNLIITYPESGIGSRSIKIYVDGKLTTPTSILDTLSSINTDSTGGIHCAGALFVATYYYGWYGELDDIGIWNRELTSCEIEKVFYGPSPLMAVITDTGRILSTSSTFTSYQWLKNDTLIPGAISNTFTSPSRGSYEVVVTTPRGCRDTSMAFSYLATGVNNITLSGEIKVYPNPSDKIFFVQSPITVNMVLTNTLGQTLMQKDDIKSFNLNNYPKGIYFLTLFDTTGRKIKTERITWLKD